MAEIDPAIAAALSTDPQRAKLYAALSGAAPMLEQESYPSARPAVALGAFGNSGVAPSEEMLKRGYSPETGGFVRGTASFPAGATTSANLGGVAAFGNQFSARPVAVDASLVHQLGGNSALEVRLAKALMDQRPTSANVYYSKRF